MSSEGSDREEYKREESKAINQPKQLKQNVPIPKTGLNFGVGKKHSGEKSPDGKTDEWGLVTPDVVMGPNRKLSDFEVVKNHAKSKRKES